MCRLGVTHFQTSKWAVVPIVDVVYRLNRNVSVHNDALALRGSFDTELCFGILIGYTVNDRQQPSRTYLGLVCATDERRSTRLKAADTQADENHARDQAPQPSTFVQRHRERSDKQDERTSQVDTATAVKSESAPHHPGQKKKKKEGHTSKR